MKFAPFTRIIYRNIAPEFEQQRANVFKYRGNRKGIMLRFFPLFKLLTVSYHRLMENKSKKQNIGIYFYVMLDGKHMTTT